MRRATRAEKHSLEQKSRRFWAVGPTLASALAGASPGSIRRVWLRVRRAVHGKKLLMGARAALPQQLLVRCIFFIAAGAEALDSYSPFQPQRDQASDKLSS